ncbi:MAG: cupin domain-containing protein [Pseudomonadota bacterium]
MTNPVVHLDEVPMRDWSHDERFAAQLARIGPMIGARQLGCQLHIVPPGKTAFPRHTHHANEEMIVVLSGTGTYHLGDMSYTVRAGAVCAAPAGYGAASAHQLVNTGEAPLHYLCLSTRHDPDVMEYPESGKVAVASGVPEGGGMRSAAAFHIWDQNAASLGYWDGEE